MSAVIQSSINSIKYIVISYERPTALTYLGQPSAPGCVCVCVYVCVCEGEGVTHYLSMVGDVLTKGSYFQSVTGRGGGVWGGGKGFIVKNLGRDSNIYLSGKGFMSVWKGGGKLH